jgi:hypothetical protein
MILLLFDIPTSGVMAQLDHIVKEPYSCTQHGCSDKGFCNQNTDTCECQPDYRGDACQIKIELCPDGDTTCYNHGTCTPDGNAQTEGGKQRYRCVCPERFNIPLFRGPQCEIKTFTSCETISQQSDEIHESFCVNGEYCTLAAQRMGCTVDRFDPFCN